jgi:hypothetical protein
MRNPVLAIAIALVLAAPCTALAGEKKEGKRLMSKATRGVQVMPGLRAGLFRRPPKHR